MASHQGQEQGQEQQFNNPAVGGGNRKGLHQRLWAAEIRAGRYPPGCRGSLAAGLHQKLYAEIRACISGSLR